MLAGLRAFDTYLVRRSQIAKSLLGGNGPFETHDGHVVTSYELTIVPQDHPGYS